MIDPEAGYVQRDGLLLACEVLECQPWFDFADLEVFASDSEAESLSTDPEELLDSDESDVLTAEEEDIFRQASHTSVPCLFPVESEQVICLLNAVDSANRCLKRSETDRCWRHGNVSSSFLLVSFH